jgi:hypothetical protein
MALLSIVIPTRDRTEYLEKSLRSVYEVQDSRVPVIVSDNSRTDCPLIHGLKLRYGFEYIRQSGRLSQAQHMNICCLELPSTPWVFLLHDDDEIAAGSLGGLLDFLAQHEDAGTAVAGIEYIDHESRASKSWLPKHSGRFEGEGALRAVGLDWGKPPGVFFNVEAARAVGGFRDICTISADYVLTCSVAFRNGAAFYPNVVGRYRTGAQQVTDTSTPQKSFGWLDFCCQQAQAVVELGCSADTAERIKDYITWWTFWGVASRWFSSHPDFVSDTAQWCLSYSPKCGPWQTRVRDAYPFLFLRPAWLGSGLCSITRRLRFYAGRAV